MPLQSAEEKLNAQLDKFMGTAEEADAAAAAAAAPAAESAPAGTHVGGVCSMLVLPRRACSHTHALPDVVGAGLTFTAENGDAVAAEGGADDAAGADAAGGADAAQTEVDAVAAAEAALA